MKKNSQILLFAVAAFLLIIAGCESQVTDVSEPTDEQTLAFPGSMDATTGESTDIEISIEEVMNTLNEKMAAEGLNYRVLMAEYITAEGSGEAGNTVFAKDVGNKQLGADFVPNDLRRTWSNNGPTLGDTDNITYAIDQTGDIIPFNGGLSGAEATAAIQRAMGTWNAQTCSDLSMTQNSDNGVDISFVPWFLSGGIVGNNAVLADIQHAGFRDVYFGPNILGVAFSFVFVGPNGPTDVDNNGKNDKAFTEIHYGPYFSWADDGTSNFDLETVALHEAGHGLSQAHFGQIFVTKSGKFKVAPLAVMNAGYTQVQRDLKGTDNGGHCSNWGNWPNN